MPEDEEEREDAREDQAALRRDCRGLLQDMLANTAFILGHGDHWWPAHPPDNPEINERLKNIELEGWGLLFLLRWAPWQLALPSLLLPASRSTVKAGWKYACLWLAILKSLELSRQLERVMPPPSA